MRKYTNICLQVFKSRQDPDPRWQNFGAESAGPKYLIRIRNTGYQCTLHSDNM